MLRDSHNAKSPYMTAEEVAEIVRVPLKTIYYWLRTGRLTGYKFGGFWRIKRRDFKEFEAEGLRIEKGEEDT